MRSVGCQVYSGLADPDQIDSYTIRAKTEIAARASDHTASVRDLHADKDEMERRITLEREREAEMLASGSGQMAIVNIS